MLRTMATGAAGLLVSAALAASAAAQPVSGGTLTLVQTNEPPGLVSALNASTYIGTVSTKIHEGLLEYGMDLKPKPGLATEWSVSPDGLTYTFKLRQGVTWHDGKPFTAEDVKFSIMKVLKVVHPRGRTTFGTVTDVETPDAHTAIFKLSEVMPPLITQLSAYDAQLLPKHVWEQGEVGQNPAVNAPIGTGPFVFKEWKKGDYIRLEKNPNYWDKGKPYLDAIIVRNIPDAGARAAAIETGEVQLGVFNPVPLADMKRLAALPGLKVETGGYDYFAPMYMFELNLRNDMLKDQRVRQAIMHAIDRKFIVDNIWFGYGKPATGPLVSSSPFYTQDGVPQYPYDVAKANKILDDAGYKRGANNMRFKLTQDYPPGPETGRTAEYIKQALGRVGIEVELRGTDLANFIRKVYTDYDFNVSQNFLYLLPDPSVGVQRLYIASNIKKGTPFSNASGYDNPELNKVWDAARIENDQAKRKALFATAQKIVQDDLPILNIFEMKFVTLASAKLMNHTITADGPYASFKEVYFAK
jgi:peptide/nickel transport system substrate-binding protein